MKVYRGGSKEWTTGVGYRKKVILEEAEMGIQGSFIQEVRFNAGETVPPHYHRIQKEVFYALTRIEFEINGERILMQPGDIVVCEPGDVHGNPHMPKESRILVIKVDFAEDDTVWMSPGP